jgi:hydroxymethylpyrimidine/phosphomethylpyrimidine kinase
MTIEKALTIAGSDSGGGAGIQADLKTFQERNVFGMSAITAITAQNTTGVQGVYPLSLEAIATQIDSVVVDLRPSALKTGMLFSAEIIELVANKIEEHSLQNVVVDPVMIAKGGASLLQQSAVNRLKEKLLPLCDVITPNIPEAEELTGMKIQTMQDRKEAAKYLSDLGAKHIVIKGGHSHTNELIDLLYDGQSFTEFTHERIATKHTHGTGCTFSACVAAELAKGASILQAVDTASEFVHAAIKHTLNIGSGHGPTNHWAYRKQEVMM